MEQNIDHIASRVINATLKILRDQRDDKQVQNLHDTYNFNPQIFQFGSHYVAGPLMFKNGFQTTPVVTFGAVAEKVITDTSIINHPTAQGFIPAIIYPYVYGFIQSSRQVDGFYLGLYSLTTVPQTLSKYSIGWNAYGKGSAYPQQRIDEAWNSSYNKNESLHLVNETRQRDPQ